MSSADIEPVDAVKVESSSEMLKSVLQALSDQIVSMKALVNTVRSVIKETDKTNKELEKIRNKKSRTKTERSANSQPSGITKPVSISDELAKFLGVAPGTLVPRNEVTKGVSGFVKEHSLSDPENKQKFILDDRPHAKALKTLLGNPTEAVTYFNLQRYLKHHYLPMPGAEPATPKASKKPVSVVVPEAAPAVSSSDIPATPKKKVVMVKKKKELTEEV